MVEEPTESVVVTTPLASVVLCTGFTPPLPDVTAHVITTPGTARPLTSCAVTLRGVGSGLLKYQLCASPPVITSSAGGPGGCVPPRSEEHTSELQSHHDLVCRLLLEKKKRSSKPRLARC